MKRCFAVLMVAAFATAAFAQEEEGTGAAKGAQVDTTCTGRPIRVAGKAQRLTPTVAEYPPVPLTGVSVDAGFPLRQPA